MKISDYIVGQDTNGTWYDANVIFYKAHALQQLEDQRQQEKEDERLYREPRTWLTRSEKQAVIRLYEQGHPVLDIAKDRGISKTTAYSIIQEYKKRKAEALNEAGA